MKNSGIDAFVIDNLTLFMNILEPDGIEKRVLIEKI